MSFPSRYPGRCALCSGAIATGELIDYDRATKRASHPACRGRHGAQDAPDVPQEGREPGEDPPTRPEPTTARRKGRRGTPLSQDDAWARTVEHGRADVVLCETCGGSAAGKPMIHLHCLGEANRVPF